MNYWQFLKKHYQNNKGAKILITTNQINLIKDNKHNRQFKLNIKPIQAF